MTNEIVIQLKAQLEIAIAFAKGVRPTLVEQRDKDWTDRLIAGWQAALNTPEPLELPRDKLGWICSICNCWNHPGNHICEHRGRPEHQPSQGASRDASSEPTCAICGDHANEHLAIPHQFMPGGRAQSASTCNHDLTTSNPTVIIDGKYDARCYVCKEEWHILHPTPQRTGE